MDFVVDLLPLSSRLDRLRVTDESPEMRLFNCNFGRVAHISGSFRACERAWGARITEFL